MQEKEFFFRGYPVGTFLNEWRPNVPGNLKYMPYRGPGHFDMQGEIRKSGVAQCYCDTDQGRHFFEVKRGVESQSLEIGNFTLAELPQKAAINLVEPWVSARLGAEKELEKEVGMHHVLFQRKCIPIARRVDQDVILFEIENSAGEHAEVHLTWSGKLELDYQFPRTIIYRNLEEWIEKMNRDHEEYMV